MPRGIYERRLRPLGERLGELISPEPNTGCWLWLGCFSDTGYGSLYYAGRNQNAHRLVYEHFIGPVPTGLHLDHLCRVRGCVNPEHLEPVTCRENLRRGTHRNVSAEINASKTHCIRGHAFDETNTRFYRGSRTGKTYRECITCVTAWRAAHPDSRKTHARMRDGQ